jgi:hypothetical protein
MKIIRALIEERQNQMDRQTDRKTGSQKDYFEAVVATQQRF